MVLLDRLIERESIDMPDDEKESKTWTQKDVPGATADTCKPTVGIGVNAPLAPGAEAKAYAPTVDIFEKRLDEFEKVLKEVKDGTTWTKRGIVVAIFVTIATAITLSFEPSIGLVDVIAAIILIGVIVAAILILQWRR